METDQHSGISLDPFALIDGEDLQRPESIRRLTFDHVYPRAPIFTTAPFARAIVPIELAQPGDEQVVVHKKASERFTQPLSIDFLANLTSVVSVVANRLVTARRSLPLIRELFVLNNQATVDQQTLVNLPGLESLSLGRNWVARELKLEEVYSYDYEADKIDLSVFHNMPALRDLRFHALATRSIEPLRSLEGLERLRIEGIASERNIAPLAGLTRLRWLALEYWKRLGRLRGLVSLERLELIEASLANLQAFKNMKKLRSLALSGRGVKSLEGIEALTALEDLFLGGPGIQELTPLASAVNLRSLKLVHPDRVADFSPLGQLESLRTLVITLGSITSTGLLENIDFISELKHLEELEISGAEIADGRLDGLFNLPDIRSVRLLGDFGHQVEELRRQKPGCAVQLLTPTSEMARKTVENGALKIRQHKEGFWSIFQDLSDLFGMANNFAADQKVRQVIRHLDPELLKRLDFDPDADFVSIVAHNEADIRQAVEIILAIINTST